MDGAEVRVGDVMSAPLVVVRDGDSLWRAMDRFLASGLRHLVVLDVDDRLVGVLGDRQLLAEWPVDAMGLRHRTVGQLLDATGRGRSASPRLLASMPLHRAGQQMLELHVDGLAVVDDSGCVIGIITGSDVVRSLMASVRAAADPPAQGE
jgi:CBS domain-containing protein